MTQDELKSRLHYDPETGIFTWLDNPDLAYNVNARIKGKKAGSINKSGYWRILIQGKTYRAHRLAFLYVYGRMPTVIDHIDGCKTNNAISNLREVTNIENSRNMKRTSRNTSGVSGVHYNTADKVWVAGITVNSKRIHGGRFKTKSDAIKVRKQLEKKYGFHENHGRD